jgi:biotin carboxyl carrier protein
MPVPTMGDSITEVRYRQPSSARSCCRQIGVVAFVGHGRHSSWTDDAVKLFDLMQGTIVEWTVDVGQAVQEGDVIALIETDKVTVDIKAKSSGVVTQRFGNV